MTEFNFFLLITILYSSKYQALLYGPWIYSLVCSKGCASKRAERRLQFEVYWQLSEAKTFQSLKHGFIHDFWP